MQKYVALVELCLPNPKRKPSSLRIKPGQIFAFDGDEGVNITQLLRQRAIKVYEEPKVEIKAETKPKKAGGD